MRWIATGVSGPRKTRENGCLASPVGDALAAPNAVASTRLSSSVVDGSGRSVNAVPTYGANVASVKLSSIGGLFDRQRIARRASAAGQVERLGREETRVLAVGGAVIGQSLEIEQLAKHQPEQRD